MSTKFFEEFTRVTDGAFPMLKLNSAAFDRNKGLLTVRFIISAFEIKNFGEDKRDEVLKAVHGIFPGVKIAVEYIRTYADKPYVKNKILEFLHNSNKILFTNLNNENLMIDIAQEDIIIKMKLQRSLYMLLSAGDLKSSLIDFLDRTFNYNIVLSAEEVAGDDGQIEFDFTANRNTTAELGELRLIDAQTGEKIYAKGKIDGASQLPNYISDIKGESDNAILCGKVSNVSRRTYANKKHEEKNAPKELPMFRFMLDDTTGKMDVVCFPRIEEADAIERALNGISKQYAAPSADGGDSADEKKMTLSADSSELSESSDVYVICIGRVSKFRDALSLTANAIFECSINFGSIHSAVKKPVPKKYVNVLPKNFVSMQQQSLLDGEQDAVNPYFADKTFVIYDLETTDKFPGSAHVIQIAALKVVDGIEKQTFETFVNPPIAIPSEITELTHISDADVDGAPSIEEVMPDFYKFTRGAVLVGHNLCGYDFPIIKRLSEKMGYHFDNELLDTLILAKKHLPEMSNYKLTTLSKSLKIEHLSAHRADSDVYATWGVLKEIAKRIYIDKIK